LIDTFLVGDCQGTNLGAIMNCMVQNANEVEPNSSKYKAAARRLTYKMNRDNQPLLQPIRLGDLDLRNRVIMAPLTRTRAINSEHAPTDLMLEYYRQRASAGLIFTEGTFVSDSSQGWYGAPGVYTEKQRKAWERITDAVHNEGSKIFVQLWHTGGVSRPELRDGLPALAPSAVDLGQQVHTAKGVVMSEQNREMSIDDIKDTIADFVQAARVAKEAGFDGIQLQAGYIYLFQQFLHDLTNRRTDDYGGNIENRARFLFETLEAVLSIWPSQRVSIKAGPMMNEHGLLKATETTLAASEYVANKLNDYNISHLFVMQQLANLEKTPIAHMAGDAVLHHFRKIFKGQIVGNSGISIEQANRIIADQGSGRSGIWSRLHRQSGPC
jgi:N-ethylmaleimide reductase